MRLSASLAMLFAYTLAVYGAGANLTSAQELQSAARQEAKQESKVVTTSATVAAPVTTLTPSEATAADFLRYVNYARSLNGAGPLTVDPYLMSLAASHTHWMASSGRFQHSSYGVAENIAMGQRSVWEVYNSWWNSSGHRQNLLGRGYSRVGLAYVNGYWTAVFQ